MKIDLTEYYIWLQGVNGVENYWGQKPKIG